MTTAAAEIMEKLKDTRQSMKRSLRVIVLLILTTLIT
ncbi:hypothetical protein Gotur_020009 [Gossypium turneri]